MRIGSCDNAAQDHVQRTDNIGTTELRQGRINLRRKIKAPDVRNAEANPRNLPDFFTGVVYM